VNRILGASHSQDEQGKAGGKIGILNLKDVRMNSEHDICPICGKEEDWSHILKRKGTKILRYEILDKRVRNLDARVENSRMQ
jgi:hypothetical protein